VGDSAVAVIDSGGSVPRGTAAARGHSRRTENQSERHKHSQVTRIMCLEMRHSCATEQLSSVTGICREPWPRGQFYLDAFRRIMGD